MDTQIYSKKHNGEDTIERGVTQRWYLSWYHEKQINQNKV